MQQGAPGNLPATLSCKNRSTAPRMGRTPKSVFNASITLHMIFTPKFKSTSQVCKSCTNGNWRQSIYTFISYSIFSRLNAGASISPKRRVQTHIAKNLGEHIPVAALAVKAGLCAQHFTKLFKISTNMTPHQYVLLKRIEQAQQLLASGMRAADVAAATGFADQSHLLQTLKRHRAGSNPIPNRISMQP